MLAEAGLHVLKPERCPAMEPPHLISRMAALQGARQFVRRPLTDLQARQPSLAVDAAGVAPLHRAAGAEDGIETMRQLLRAGANVHTTDRGGATALHYAARSGHAEAAKSLLKHCAKVDVQDKAGVAPLSLALAGRFDDMVRLLLKARADPCRCTSSNSAGEPMLVTLSREGRSEAARMLLQARAEPDQHSPNGGSTPLQLAATNAQMDLLWELLRAGARPDFVPVSSGKQPDVLGELTQNPLRLAAQRGHATVVQALLTAAADANSTSQDGVTTIALAAARGHTEVLNVLLKGGADLEDARPPRPRIPKQRICRASAQGLMFCLRPDAVDRVRGSPPCDHNAAERQIAKDFVSTLLQTAV